jgi:AraC family transcriptional regulator
MPNLIVPEVTCFSCSKPTQDTGVVIDRFPNGRRLALNRVDTATLTSVVSDYDRDHPVSGVWHSESLHYLDLSVSGRPKGAWGRFPDAFSELERVGKMLFIPAGHRYSGQGGSGRQRSITVFFHAPAQFEDDPIFGEELEPVLRNCVHLQGSTVTDLMIRIGRETEEPGIASKLILEGLGLTLLGEAARLLHGLRSGRAYKGGLATWRLKLIEERIRNEGSLSTITELATLCGMSPRHLIRAFRQQTGHTIGSFVQQITIERARQLLAETDNSIKVVAAKLGFSSSAAFATAFRRSCGLSPREFRTNRPTAATAWPVRAYAAKISNAAV